MNLFSIFWCFNDDISSIKIMLISKALVKITIGDSEGDRTRVDFVKLLGKGFRNPE
jgi:hypothetical protein